MFLSLFRYYFFNLGWRNFRFTTAVERERVEIRRNCEKIEKILRRNLFGKRIFNCRSWKRMENKILHFFLLKRIFLVFSELERSTNCKNWSTNFRRNSNRNCELQINLTKRLFEIFLYFFRSIWNSFWFWPSVSHFRFSFERKTGRIRNGQEKFRRSKFFEYGKKNYLIDRNFFKSNSLLEKNLTEWKEKFSSLNDEKEILLSELTSKVCSFFYSF